MGLEEEEANNNSGHKTETVGWLAMDTGSGLWDGNAYYAGTTGDTVKDQWSDVEFNSLFENVPQFLASLASYDGADPAGLRYQNLDSGGVEIKVEEDTSVDSEIIHKGESVDFLAIEASGSLSGFAVESGSGVFAFGEQNSLVAEDETSLFDSNELI